MTYYAFSALANGLSSSAAGLFIFHSCRIQALRRTYIFFCISVCWWSVFYFLWQVSTDQYYALAFCRLLMLGAIFVPVTNLHHLVVLLNAEKRHFILLRSLYLLGLFWVILTSFTPLIVKSVSPIGPFRFWPMAGLLFTPFLVSFIFAVFFAVYLIINHLYDATGIKRTQLVYVLIGTLIGWSGAATNFPLWYGIHILPVGNIMVSVYIFCIGYAIVKHRLMDITVIIRKTLVYSMVMAILTLTYLAVVTLFTHLFEGLTGYQTIFSSAVAAGLITICFQPLRKRVQAFVDGKFFRQHVDREEKLYELSREVVTHTTAEAMGEALTRVLGEALHPKSAALFLRARDGNGFVRLSQEREASSFPNLIAESNPLVQYFVDHPQPFVQDLPSEVGEPQNTRTLERKE